MSGGATSGELAVRALALVLLDLHEAKVTGRLLLRRGRISKTIDLADGDPVNAASSMRDETLGHFLTASGVISHDQHRAAIELATKDGIVLGQALVKLRVLTPDVLLRELTNQTRHKLTQSLRWPQGSWRFDPGPIPDRSLKLHMPDVVLTGLRDHPPDMAQLQAIGQLRLELTPRGQALLSDLYRVFSAAAIDALMARGQPVDMEAVVGDPMRALVICEALVASGTALPIVQPRGMGTATPSGRETARAESLYALFFDEVDAGDDRGARELVEFDDEAAPQADADGRDSGSVSPAQAASLVQAGVQADAARRTLLEVHGRLAHDSLYELLGLTGRATTDAIGAALTDLESRFASTYYARFNLGGDRPKLDEVHAALARARETLFDEVARRTYDRELAGGDLTAQPPSLDTEALFRTAEDLLARRQWAAAVEGLTAVLRRAPDEPDYLAALGWATWQARGKDSTAAGEASPLLTRALATRPEHAAAHEYMGLMVNHLGHDATLAGYHLERAVLADPRRLGAWQAVAEHWRRQGQARKLERTAKHALHKATGQPIEAAWWVILTRIYAQDLDDLTRAAFCLSQARRFPINGGDVPALEQLVAGVRQGQAGLRRTGSKISVADVGFMTAAIAVVRGTADAATEAFYQGQVSHRLADALRPLQQDEWAVLRHPDDDLEVGGLIELLAPALVAASPMSLAELDLEPGSDLADEDLSEGFAKTVAYARAVMGAPSLPVFPRADFGADVHVAMTDRPLLLAGDDALIGPMRVEGMFRVARALTFAWPGRAIATSRPGRLVKQVVLACYADALGVDPAEIDPACPALMVHLATLPPDDRRLARAAVMRILTRNPRLNLSRWARAVTATANRVGLLLAGDPVVASKLMRAAGAPLDDMLAFAESENHLSLRARLGIAMT